MFGIPQGNTVRLFAILLLFCQLAWGLGVNVTITNLTRGITFAPLLIVVHAQTNQLFKVGQKSSYEMQIMAEKGDISELVLRTGNSAQFHSNPANGMLGAGKSTGGSIRYIKESNTHLSIVGMMLPTNDAFVGLGSVKIPTEVGTYVYYAKAYDAGTEANDELASSISNFATGRDGTGLNVATEGFIHIHRGVVGDTNAHGGISDLDSMRHRWLNPVARVEVVVY